MLLNVNIMIHFKFKLQFIFRNNKNDSSIMSIFIQVYIKNTLT